MHRKDFGLLCMTITLLGVVLFLSTSKTGLEPEVQQPERSSMIQKRFVNNNQKKHQKNHLSTILHALKRDIVKIACELEDVKSDVKTLSGDHDCEQTLAADLASASLDHSFADKLALWRFNKTLAIFGDPLGSYKIYLDSKRPAKQCSSYAGDVNAPDRSNGVVQYLDLRVPQYTLPVFDWVLIFLHRELRTGKELSVLVDNLVSHDRFGLVLVWTGSVDTEKKAAVHQALKKKIVFDSLKTRELRDICRSEFKENIFVYRKESET